MQIYKIHIVKSTDSRLKIRYSPILPTVMYQCCTNHKHQKYNKHSTTSQSHHNHTDTQLVTLHLSRFHGQTWTFLEK